MFRTRAATAVATALLLGLATTACGGGDGGGATAKKDDTPAAGAEKGETDAGADDAAQEEPGTDPAAGPLDKAGLDKVALTDGDVEGWSVRTPSPSEVAGQTKEKADKPECQPLASLIGGIQEPEPAATVYRGLASEEKGAEGVILFEILSSYGGDEAAESFADLEKAAGSCQSGFTTTNDGGDKTVYTDVKQGYAPDAGEESLTYTVTGDLAGDQVPLAFTVVRSGSTVASFYSMNALAETPGDTEVPQAAVTAQARKLR